jgi:transcriptional regulator GlxA family with amidase domain
MLGHHIQIILFDGVQSLDVTGPLEVFTYAGGYRITTASIGDRPVRTSSGLRLVPDEALEEPTADTLVVPGGQGTREPHAEVVEWLREHGSVPGRIMSVCTGAFLLAEAGLLKDRRATTHWQFCDSLSGRHPSIDVDPSPIFVRDGHIATSAGVTAGIDLALALVEEDRGRDVALAIARDLVMFLRRPGGQAQFSAQLAGQIAHRSPLSDVQRLISDHPDSDLSVPALAAHANLSPRQFTRAFTAEIGVPPGRYVDRVRLETARRLLEDTGDGIAEIARRAGYGTAEAMRRAFIQALEVPPAEYRRRFSGGTT